MPPNFFQKPETALKRAQELISVGKEQDALETLHDTIKSKRHKQWTKTHEAIMLKHMELCVLLRRSHVAKDALFQYKSLTQQIAVKSLETVILKFLELAQQKTEEAQKTSIEKVEEIDDLDMADAPENLLLSAVSGDAAQDRMDRTVLSPWLRFLWDSYRNCLDLLRNTAVIEQLYHRIARQSFEFCAKYQRRTEFRKLCDNLRLHLTQIQKHQYLPHVVKLTSAESLTLMQDTRLIQLDTAIQMELWQEAYRSAEDVHGMMQLSKDKDKRMVKPASYVNYYDKLALVFWKAGNRLFHAAALLQKYIIYKDMKKTFSSEEAMDQATRVLLATLAIPDGADNPSDLTRNLDIEEQHVANMRLLSNLLRLPIAPTRFGILKEITRLNLTDVAMESARTLYCLLEANFSPLRLANQVQTELDKIIEMSKPEYAQYVNELKAVTATKIVKQLSVIYDCLSIERIETMIPFYDALELERFFVDISKHRYVKARIDHRTRSIQFGVADASQTGVFDLEALDASAEQLVVEDIRNHLQLIYNNLREMVNVLDRDEIRKNAIVHLKRHADIYSCYKERDYERILMRRKRIEAYKETSERKRFEKSKQAQEEANRKEEQRRAKEMRRLEQENLEKEKMRRMAEQEEIDRKVRAEKMKKIQATPIYQAIIKDHGEEAFQNMDPDSVLREQRDRLDEQRREQQARLQQQEKKFDHLVRAYHLQEMVIRKALTDDYAAKAPLNHENYDKLRIENSILEHENAIAVYERMEKVRIDAAEFLNSVKMSHRDDFHKKMKDWETSLDEARRKRLEERRKKRIDERRREWYMERAKEQIRQREAAEQAKRDEQEKERRAARDAQRPPKREQIESIPDADMDWRRSSQATLAKASQIHRPNISDHYGDGERQRERAPVPPSQADSGPWLRGNIVSASKPPADGPTRIANPERPRFQDREPARVESETAMPWRRGQIVRKDKPPGHFTERGATSGTSVTDAGPWKRGQVVTRSTEIQQPDNAASGGSQPYRPRMMRQTESAVNGTAQRTFETGSDPNARRRDGLGPPPNRPPPRREIPRRSAADEDKNWRKK